MQSKAYTIKQKEVNLYNYDLTKPFRVSTDRTHSSLFHALAIRNEKKTYYKF